MVPFMYGSVSRPSCFDERSPCTEEQTAFCVIDIAQKADPSTAQDKIVPWQICHCQGNDFDTCHAKVGIASSDVSACLSDTSRIHGLMQTYLDRGKNVRGTPYELVNDKEVSGDSTYANVKKAICAADSTLSACASDVVV